VDEALHAGALGRIDDIPGPSEMDAFERDALGGALHDDADEVDDGGAAVQALVEGGGIEEGAVDGVHAVGVHLNRPTIDQSVDGVVAGDQLVDHRRSDKTAGSGHEDGAAWHESRRSFPRTIVARTLAWSCQKH
jgi:hypothetical protein